MHPLVRLSPGVTKGRKPYIAPIFRLRSGQLQNRKPSIASIGSRDTFTQDGSERPSPAADIQLARVHMEEPDGNSDTVIEWPIRMYQYSLCII